MTKFENLYTVLKNQKLINTIKFIFNGVLSEGLKIFGKMMIKLNLYFTNISLFQLKRQSSDDNSILGFIKLLEILNIESNKNYSIKVPSYLHKAFLNIAQLQKNNLNVNRVSDSEFVSTDFVLIAKAMKSNVNEDFFKIEKQFELVYENAVFWILKNKNIKLNLEKCNSTEYDLFIEINSSNSNTEKVKVIKHKDLLFKIRNRTMDSVILDEVQFEYFDWKSSYFNSDLKVVIDLGSQIGGFSVKLSQFLTQDSKIYAFEPEPSNFELIKENIKLNHLENLITPIEAAVSNKDGFTELFISEDNTGGNKIGSREPSSTKSVNVKTVDILKFVSQFEKIDLIKIDIEGWELVVLKQLLPAFSKIKYIIGESQKTESGDAFQVIKFLEKNGFKVDSKGDFGQQIFFAERA